MPPKEQNGSISGLTSDETESDSRMEDITFEEVPPIGLAWDGPGDPGNPLNWPASKRRMHIITIAFYTLITNLASTMFAPAATQLASEFHITDSTVVSLAVSIFVLGFALGPLLLAPLSELYGRLPVYIASGVGFIAFLFGSAFATDIGSFIAFRLLCGCSGAAPLAIGLGSLADITPPKDRVKWMGLFILGPMLGPVIGPIAGGFISENIGWRWAFRVLLIASGVAAFMCFFWLRETYAPVILRHRAERRKKGLSGNAAIMPPGEAVISRLFHDMTRPMRLLIFSPIVLFLSLYAAFAFGLMFLLFTTFSTVFKKQYGFSTGITGLTYLGLGIGVFVGLFTQTVLGQKIVESHTRKRGSTRPEDRLAFMAYVAPVLPIGLFWYGWSVEARTHWIVPILGNLPVGFGFVSIMMPQMIYLLEIFGAEAGASAVAANTVFRSLVGALLPLAGPTMYENLGYGWGNSLLAFLAIAFIPVPWILYLYGDKIRKSRKIDI
nr:fluconazole resistance protein 1 [Colletotrichum truncatum]KAF6781947.1 fluconazole resistance protein 1 [Colletotrichum truncatum]